MCGVYVCEGMIVSAFRLANYTFHLKGDLETVLPNVRRINTVGCHPTGWDVRSLTESSTPLEGARKSPKGSLPGAQVTPEVTPNVTREVKSLPESLPESPPE